MSFVHRLEFASEDRSQSPFIDIFTHCFTCRYTEAEAQCRMEKKVLWARTAVSLVILIKRHNLSCSFCFKLKLQWMHECISIVSYVPGGVQFSKRLDFHCYQGDSFRSWKTLFCLREITSPSKNCKWRGRTQSCSSGLCTGKNLIFFKKSKPHICINSSKFLWPLSLSRHCWLVIFEYLIQ